MFPCTRCPGNSETLPPVVTVPSATIESVATTLKRVSAATAGGGRTGTLTSSPRSETRPPAILTDGQRESVCALHVDQSPQKLGPHPQFLALIRAIADAETTGNNNLPPVISIVLKDIKRPSTVTCSSATSDELLSSTPLKLVNEPICAVLDTTQKMFAAMAPFSSVIRVLGANCTLPSTRIMNTAPLEPCASNATSPATSNKGAREECRPPSSTWSSKLAPSSVPGVRRRMMSSNIVCTSSTAEALTVSPVCKRLLLA